MVYRNSSTNFVLFITFIFNFSFIHSHSVSSFETSPFLMPMPWSVCAFHPRMAPLKNTASLSSLSLNTFMCIQYQHPCLYIKLGHCDNSYANMIETINTSLHKAVIPTAIAQLPCAHMACLRYDNPKWPKLTSLKLRLPVIDLVWKKMFWSSGPWNYLRKLPVVLKL